VITWVFDEDSFSPVAKLRADKKYSILSDYLGTPTHVFNDSGEVIWEAALDSYGKLRVEKGTLGSCPFRYQGQYEDVETNLAYNRYRYYSPEEGIYISQDPIGLQGGQAFYGYVPDPNAYVDIFGLTKTYGKGFVMTSKKKTNKREGGRREDTFGRILEEKHGKNNVLKERMLLDKNGNKVTSGGTGRRVDYVVLDDNGKAIHSYEVTSKTADKGPQLRKETNIRNNGGTFVKDANGNLVDVSNTNTSKVIRIK
jgi:RHS repeat-associated protein